MIVKIVSCGRSGASKAAVDVAVKMGISYDGWTCTSIEEDPVDPTDRYVLKITESSGYREFTTKNIDNSNGTIIFSEGKLPIVGKFAEKITVKMHKHLLVVNLHEKNGFFASRHIAEWIISNDIKILHITGMSEKESPGIYNKVMKVLEASLFLCMIEIDRYSGFDAKDAGKNREIDLAPPQTIEQAVDRLEKELSLKDKAAISNMSEGELPALHATIGSYVEKRFMVFQENDLLYESCIDFLGIGHFNRKAIATIVIKELWRKLKKDYRIRIIKS